MTYGVPFSSPRERTRVSWVLGFFGKRVTTVAPCPGIAATRASNVSAPIGLTTTMTLALSCVVSSA